MACTTPTTPLQHLRINGLNMVPAYLPLISYKDEIDDLLHTSESFKDYKNYKNSPESTLSTNGNFGLVAQAVEDNLPDNKNYKNSPESKISTNKNSEREAQAVPEGQPDNNGFEHQIEDNGEQYDDTSSQDDRFATGKSCGIKRQYGTNDLSYNNGFDDTDRSTYCAEDGDKFNELTIIPGYCGSKRQRGIKEWSDTDGCKYVSRSPHCAIDECHSGQDTESSPLYLHSSSYESACEYKLLTSAKTEECECSCDENNDFSDACHLEENTSRIFIQLAKEKRYAGFSITTDKSSHRISGVSKLVFPDLDFRENDKIVAIQTMSVEHWEHQILRDFLCHLFDPEIKTFTMVFQRGDMYNEITIEVVEFDNEFTDLSVRVRRMITYKLQKPFTKVRLVECLGVKLCTISHITANNGKLYFRINDRGKLVLDHYSLEDEKSYRFQIVQYKGIQRCNNQPEGVLFCRLISVLTEQCLTIKGLTKVGLMDSIREDRNAMNALTRPDPRYFKCNRTSDDRTKWTIESLVHPGLYVAVNPEKSKIFLSDTNVQGDSHFEIMYQ